MISKQVIEDIRLRCDIVEVIGSYLTLKRAGATFKALCPFHKEKTPSFNVNPQRQIFHCFGCGVGGDVFKFIMEHEHVDFYGAIRILAERAGVRLEEERRAGADDGIDKQTLYKLHEEVAQLYHKFLLTSPEAVRAREYLQERELDGDTIRQFLIGQAPDRWDSLLEWGRKKNYTPKLLTAAGLVLKSDRPDAKTEYYDRFRNRLMFPIRDEMGRVIAFSGRVLDPQEKSAKYVNSPETALFRKGRVLYALDQARKAILDSRTAVIVEGQIDCIRCHRAGVANVVASQGTAITEDHAHLLKRYADSVVGVLDADAAGQKAAVAAAEIFLAAELGVAVAALPPGEDPDTLIRKQGGDAFRRVLAGAVSIVEFQAMVLRAREDISTEAGLLRASRALLETISRAPTAVYRDKLVQQAAQALRIPESALRQDLTRQARRAARPAEPAAPAASAAPAHPADEVALAEILAHCPAAAPEIRQYLPRQLITDAVCRDLIERMLAHVGEAGWTLVADLDSANEAAVQLAARIGMSAARVAGTEITALDGARQLILRIWRNALERRRAKLRERLAGAAAEERRALEQEFKQLTLDIKALQQGWATAKDILEMQTL